MKKCATNSISDVPETVSALGHSSGDVTFLRGYHR